MRLPLVVSVLFIAVPISAQQPASSKKTEGAPKPKIVAPAPTPAPKRGVLGRIFGKKPTPTPAPTPQPVVAAKPKPRPRPKARPAAQPEETTPAAVAETPKPAGASTPPAGDQPPKPAGTADPAATTEPSAAPAGEQPKNTAKNTKPGKPGKNTPKPAETANLDEATKYQNARTAALEDEKIKDLKNKADSAISEDEAQRTSLAYNKALFRKIRDLDPSIDAYVDKLEQAMMKRLSAEKKSN
jgi:hypothetical protein